MPGGQLVVLDRLGRDVKRFPLPEGVVTLGSDHSCDIRFMLDTVDPHHATVAVHANQTVVRSVCGGPTLVNGAGVSVAALRHGDVIGIGGRDLRWEYSRPAVRRLQAPLPALAVSRRRGGSGSNRRASGPAAAATRRDAALQAALEMSHRASMPANAGGKQVAIVQPQRRDTSEQNDKATPRSPQTNKRPRASKNDADNTAGEADMESKRPARAARTPVTTPQNTTKATLWIEARKSTPRKSSTAESPKPASRSPVLGRRSAVSSKKSTPLRLTVLRKVQSARKATVAKIEAPTTIDHTKQAALLLMTGHTPKSKLLSPKSPSPKSSTSTPNVSTKSTSSNATLPKSASPKKGRRSASFVVKKRSSIRNSTPRGRTSRSSAGTATPGDLTSTTVDAPEAEGGASSRHRSSRRSETSPGLPSPRKSALKNPLANRSMRKTESIKFDLSNLEGYSRDVDASAPRDASRSRVESVSEDELALRYSDASPSPSPRRSIHSRGGRMLERSLGTPVALSPGAGAQSRTLTPGSARSRRSARGRELVARALSSSRRSKSAPGGSSPRRTRTPSPQPALESYSIVDLVSADSTASPARSTSVYDSAESSVRSGARSTRSTIEPTLLGSSTPYVRGGRRSRPDPDATSTALYTTRSRSSGSSRASLESRKSRLSTGRTTFGSPRSSTGSARSSTGGSRKTKTLSTPENASIPISVNSTRVSRASRSRSRLDDSDLLLVELDEASPRSSRRAATTATTAAVSPPAAPGISTPDNTQSPEDASTPVLSIQSLLDSSHGSVRPSRAGRPPSRRRTIGVPTGSRARPSAKSKSMSFARARRLSHDSYENMNVSVPGVTGGVPATPRSAAKPLQEAVKNKHSSAKKPQSKRSIIDDLNESDVSKQLFSSPVKRKLSHSITEISRKQLFDDEDPDESRVSRALVRTPDDSLLDHTEAITPEHFVSPISSPAHSPNLAGVKRLYARNSPRDDLRNVRGVKALLRTPRARKSIKNDLTDVAGVKEVFAAGPRNRLSDVRVKEVFAASPANDLRRVSGVKALFQSERKRKSPRNSLGDVRGVKKLFNQGSPSDDLRNVSGVKRTLKRRSPANDLSDVRGVKRLFRRDNRNELSDVSGVEELFNESSASHRDNDSVFDQLVGKPTIRAVYSRTFTRPKPQKKRSPKSKSLLSSLDLSLSTEEWLKENLKMLQELRKRRSAEAQAKSSNKSNVTRELQKLSIATVEGSSPLATSRVRTSTVLRVSGANKTIQKSASESYESNALPLKKRSYTNALLEKTRSDSLVNLPIKKRAVVHSTPVKGRLAHVTMNASELGRVSPIVPDKHRDLDNELARSTIEKATPEVRPKSRRATRAQPSAKSPNKTRGKSKVPSPNKTASPDKKSVRSAKKSVSPTKKAESPATKAVSPAKKAVTPAKKAESPAKKAVTPAKKAESPAKKAVTPAKKAPRSAKKVESPEPLSPLPAPISPLPVSPKTTRTRRAPISPKAAPKRGAKLVVANKSPVMSPQPASRKRKEPESLPTPKASPKKTRAARNKDEKVVKTPKTPKNTRAKVLKATVVVSKPSPHLKPRTTRGKPKVDEVEKPKEVQKVAEPKATRKAAAKTKSIESPKKSPVPSPKKSRRKAPVEVTVEVVPKTRGKGKTTVVKDVPQQSNVEAQPKTRRGRTAVEEETVVPKRTRKTEKQEVADKKTNKKQTSVEESKAQDKKTNKQEKSEETKTTRGKRNIQQETIQPEPSTRSRRGAKTDVPKPEVNTRKRKTDTPDVRPSKVSKGNDETVPSRGRNKKIESPKTVNVAKKPAGKGAKAVSVDVPKKGRAKKVDASVEVAKKAPQRATRGQKNAGVEVAPEVGRRARKPAVDAVALNAGVAARRSRRR